MSDPASGSEVTRDLAAQPKAPETHFDTPNWVGPDRHPEWHATHIPEQTEPTHDTIERPAAKGPSIVESAHWVGSSTGRTAVGLIIIAGLMATLGAGVLTWRYQTGDAAVLLGICAAVTVGLWTVMAATKPMVVDLKGSMLTVRHHNTEDVFNLSDPFQVVELRGAPGSPSWSLALGRRDGSMLVVGSRTVRSTQLHPAVVHYRLKADQVRDDRDKRFGR